MKVEVKEVMVKDPTDQAGNNGGKQTQPDGIIARVLLGDLLNAPTGQEERANHGEKCDQSQHAHLAADGKIDHSHP